MNWEVLETLVLKIAMCKKQNAYKYRWTRINFENYEGNETRYRMDDTINIGRKSNLSVDFNASIPMNTDDVDVDQELLEHYGRKLLELFECLFDFKVHQNQYICNGESRPITNRTKVIFILVTFLYSLSPKTANSLT
jgi:hypothetical protein